MEYSAYNYFVEIIFLIFNCNETTLCMSIGLGIVFITRGLV